jgi:hypothetical protein
MLDIAWSDLEESAQVVNVIIKDSINIDDLFDECTLLNQVPHTIEEKWKAIFKAFQKTDI